MADFLRNREKNDPDEEKYELAEKKYDPAEGKYELAEEKYDPAEEINDPAERKREQFFSWGERLSADIQLHIIPLNPIGDPSGAKVQIIEKHFTEATASAQFGRLDQIQIDSAEGGLSRFPLRDFRIKSATHSTRFIAGNIGVPTAGTKSLN